MARHDLEKENRPPNNMVTSAKGNQAALTPGRRKKTQDQYFDVGKVGRKTGITLKDTGVRDEHGLEPVEGIFSSPALPERPEQTSSDGHMQESSGQDVDHTLHLRKTPKFPPPRQATPKHTNIGSPKRLSSARPQTRAGSVSVAGSDRSPTSHLSKTQPPPNRVLDFAPTKAVKSIEPSSPFRPKRSLRRSHGQTYVSLGPSHRRSVDTEIDVIEEAENEIVEEDVSLPTMSGALQENEDHEMLPAMESPVRFDDDQDAYQIIEDEPIPDLTAVRTEASARNSSVRLSSVPAPESPWQPGSRKRNRSSYEDHHGAQEVDVSLAQAQHNGYQSDGPSRTGSGTSSVHEEAEDESDQTIDPNLLQTDGEARTENKGREARKQSEKAGLISKPGKRATIDDSNENGSSDQRQRPTSNRERGAGPAGAARASAGPSSKFHLRATTPFEDAGGRVSRFGRTLIEPLKFWANETKVYKHGEMDGIIRAEEVPEKPKKKPRKKPGRKRNKESSLDAIGEDSETESCHPDEWEDEIGVLAGFVANWDPEKQVGNAEDLIKYDLAFAASSIIQRDAPGSNFSYAKILTSGFFGSGMVELPPSGFKSVKNSRNMEMVFFVAEGKVMVEIGTEDSGPNQFAISAGGCWFVPRGNNYSLANESTRRPAKIWFAQGCET